MSLRAYSPDYMNDLKDTSYMLDEVAKLMAAEDDTKESKEDILRRMKDNASFFYGEPFIMCLTTLNDNLHMWREYGDRGHGAAIEFSIDNKNMPCSIENDKKKVCIHPKMYQCLYWTPQEIKNNYYELYKDHFMANGQDFSDTEIAWNSSIIKHPLFKEEGENRIIVVAQEGAPITYEECDGHIKKYVTLLFDTSCIKRIVLGPMVNGWDFNAIKEYVTQQMSGVSVERSSIM